MFELKKNIKIAWGVDILTYSRSSGITHASFSSLYQFFFPQDIQAFFDSVYISVDIIFAMFKQFHFFTSTFDIRFFFQLFSDGKYHMLPTGELLIFAVNPDDKHHGYRCRTVDHVTGAPVESSTLARLIVTGEFVHFLFIHFFLSSSLYTEFNVSEKINSTLRNDFSIWLLNESSIFKKKMANDYSRRIE